MPAEEPSPAAATYAATAAGQVGAEEAEEVLVHVHSNYVPAQMDKHLEFLDFSSDGSLAVGSSSLVTRYWTGQLWYFTKDRLAEDGVQAVTDPARCLTGLELETGVVAGRFLAPGQLVVGLDSGGLVRVTLARERDEERVTHHLEVQSPAVEHEDQLLGLDLWPEGGECRVATTGADLRLNVWGPELALTHSYLPAHTRLITGVACSPESPYTVATASQDGTVKVWDTRSAAPALTVHRSPVSPPSCLAWAAGGLVTGTRAGGLLLLDPRAPITDPAPGPGLFFDREVRSLRWDGSGRRLAVTADDAVVKVVEVRGGGLVEVYQDRRHTDYVRGLAWAGDTLWSAGWDTAVLTHALD